MIRHRLPATIVGLAAASLCLAASPAASHAQAPADHAGEPLMRDFMGINGHTVQFKASLYAPLCRLVRDYHSASWDFGDDSSAQTTFPLSRNEIGWKDESGRFRDFQGRINWAELYGGWQEAGFEIDASLMLGEAGDWNDLERDAYRYGKAFAEFFGPSGEQKLVTSVEIGNEPAGNDRFTPQQYQTLFRAMAKGVRAGDPAMTILTANAYVEAGGYEMPLKIFEDTPKLYDVINIHGYAQLHNWPTWERSFPEDPRIEYLKRMQEVIDWRDDNAPDKQVWLTEFGYDASTQPGPDEGTFKDWVDVTDEHQAQWIVRSFLCFAAMDIDRAYLYWFNDKDTPSLHAASGVTRHFVPKPSYYAMRHLYQSLGDYRLGRVVRQDAGELYIYEFVHGDDPDKLVWVVWSPTGEGRETEVELSPPGEVVKAERMPMADGDAEAVEIEQAGGGVTITATESPAYLWVQR